MTDLFLNYFFSLQMETEKVHAVENGKSSDTPEPELDIPKDHEIEPVLKRESLLAKSDGERLASDPKCTQPTIGSEKKESLGDKSIAYRLTESSESMPEGVLELKEVEEVKSLEDKDSTSSCSPFTPDMVTDIPCPVSTDNVEPVQLLTKAQEEVLSIASEEDLKSIEVIDTSSVQVRVLDNRNVDNKELEEGGKDIKEKIRLDSDDELEKEKDSVKIEDVVNESAGTPKKGETSKNEDESKSDEEEKKDEDKKEEASDEENSKSELFDASNLISELEPEVLKEDKDSADNNKESQKIIDQSTAGEGGEREESHPGETAVSNVSNEEQLTKEDGVPAKEELAESQELEEVKEETEVSEEDASTKDHVSGLSDIKIPVIPQLEMIATISGSLHEKDKCEKQREAKLADEGEKIVQSDSADITVTKRTEVEKEDSESSSAVALNTSIDSNSVTELDSNSREKENSKSEVSKEIGSIDVASNSSLEKTNSDSKTLVSGDINETPVSNVSSSVSKDTTEVSASEDLVEKSSNVCDIVQRTSSSVSSPKASSPVCSAPETPKNVPLTQATCNTSPETKPEQTSTEVQVVNKEVQEKVNEEVTTPITKREEGPGSPRSPRKETLSSTVTEGMKDSPVHAVSSSLNDETSGSPKKEMPVPSDVEKAVNSIEVTQSPKRISMEALPVIKNADPNDLSENNKAEVETVVVSSSDPPKDQESQTEETGEEELNKAEEEDVTESKTDGTLSCGDTDKEEVTDVDERVKCVEEELVKDQSDLGLRRQGIALTGQTTSEKEKDRQSEEFLT